MTTAQRTSVVAVFTDRHQADRAVDELLRAGFRKDQIGVLARDSQGTTTTKSSSTAADKGTGAAVGAATGAVAGAGVGGLVALGILAGLIPGIGPAIAGGTLAVVLANAAGGAAIAGIAGALIGMGVAEEEAKHYETEFKAGRIIVVAHQVGGRYEEAWNILHRNGGYNRQSPHATAGASR
jgi:hypothetical protein